jgi:hypothetical protein
MLAGIVYRKTANINTDITLSNEKGVTAQDSSRINFTRLQIMARVVWSFFHESVSAFSKKHK